MDTTMTLVDALIVASIFLPLIVLGRMGNNSKRKLYQQFKVVAKKNGLNITEKEFWASSYIGIDEAKKMVLFIQKDDDVLREELIDLNEVKNCKINTSVKSVNTKSIKQNTLVKVDLEIYFAEPKTPMKSISIYDHNRMYSEDFEIKRAEKWKKAIEANGPYHRVDEMSA